MDYTTLLRVSRELKPQLVPGRLEQAIQSDDTTLLLQFKSLSGLYWLLLSWHPEAARVTLTRGPQGGAKASSSLYSLPKQIRGFLQLKTLIGVSMQAPGERILSLDFADRMTDTAPTHQLHVEVMGRRSNVVLVDASDRTVLACGYQVSPSKSIRAIGIGQPYDLPPPQGAPLPGLRDTTEEDFMRRIGLIPELELKTALISAYRGLSPQIIEVMAETVGTNGSVKVGHMGQEKLVELYRGPFRTWLEVLAGASAPPAGMSTEGDRYTPVVFEPLDGDTAGRKVVWEPMASPLELVGRYYTSCIERQELLDLRRRGLARVQVALSRLQRTRQGFVEQLEAADEPEIEKLQTKAELLTTYAYSWKEGDTEVQCYDLKTGEPITVPLRQGKSAADDAQDAYKRIRKLRRSVDAVRPLLEQIELKIAYVEELQESIEQLGQGSVGAELEVMREIADELGLEGPGVAGVAVATFFSNILSRLSVSRDADTRQEGGRGGAQAKSSAKKGKGSKGTKGKGSATVSAGKAQTNKRPTLTSYCSSEAGPVVFVGRNSKQNDFISFSMAKDHELWFHAQGVPGSHCLLRFDPGTDVGEDDMQLAADLAALYSKARRAAEVPVMYTSPKNLKRVIGGGPGMVQVTKEKVMWGKPERAERVVREHEQRMLDQQQSQVQSAPRRTKKDR